MKNTDFFKCNDLSSVDNICKQFGPRSGPIECRFLSGSKLFDTLISVFFLSDDNKIMKNYPACKEFKIKYLNRKKAFRPRKI